MPAEQVAPSHAQHVWLLQTDPLGEQKHQSPRQHMLSLQVSPALQRRPQTPQLLSSEKRSLHTPLQQFCPVGQEQVRSLPQPSGIVPQNPAGHVACVQQVPWAQIWPGAQVLSQLPQFSGSVWRSVHSSPQQTWPSGQHSPTQQASSLGQHASPQQVCPAWQHSLPQQTCPEPQAPQLRVPPQPSEMVPHCLTSHVLGVQQAPRWQTWCASGQLTHAFPAVPQDCVVVPGWQAPWSQQPVGQVCGEQGTVPWHWPVEGLHLALPGQLPHVSPLPQPSSPHCRPSQSGVQQFPAGLHWLAASLQHPSLQESEPWQQ
jgi:hypothetical protein